MSFCQRRCCFSNIYCSRIFNIFCLFKNSINSGWFSFFSIYNSACLVCNLTIICINSGWSSFLGSYCTFVCNCWFVSTINSSWFFTFCFNCSTWNIVYCTRIPKHPNWFFLFSFNCSFICQCRSFNTINTYRLIFSNRYFPTCFICPCWTF